MNDTAEDVRTPFEPAGPAPAPAPGENRLRRNAVSFPGALAQSVSVMAPAMSGAFITYLAAIKAGGATPLAFLLATGSCLLIGGSSAASPSGYRAPVRSTPTRSTASGRSGAS